MHSLRYFSLLICFTLFNLETTTKKKYARGEKDNAKIT